MSAPESKDDLIRRTEAFLERHEQARKLVEHEERLSEARKERGDETRASQAERDEFIKALVTISAKR
jgi:hypothetical protein